MRFYNRKTEVALLLKLSQCAEHFAQLIPLIG